MAARSTLSPNSFLPLSAVSFEILLALAEGGRHGYDIMLEIERRTGGRVSLNPVDATILRPLPYPGADRLVAIVEELQRFGKVPFAARRTRQGARPRRGVRDYGTLPGRATTRPVLLTPT
jgi:hypothetical protein